MTDTSSSPAGEPEPFDDVSYVPEPTDHFGNSTKGLAQMGAIGSILIGAVVVLKIYMTS